MSAGLSARTVVATFARLFLIQGSWNYHTMLGSGFAFVMLPGLRSIFAADPDRFADAVERHLEVFNAHPYLSSVAVGASLRLEADGADPETVARFKAAVRGPLGSLGDALVWATWLPGVAMASLALYWLGFPGWLAGLFFLAVFNFGHVALRIWGLRVGLQSGRDVGAVLGSADLGGWTKRLQPLAALLLGLLAGAILGGERGLGGAGAGWAALAAGGFVVGLIGGHKTWRPAAVLTVVAVSLIASWGMLK